MLILPDVDLMLFITFRQWLRMPPVT